MLRRLYREEPDPGFHAAAQWTLMRFQQEEDLASMDDQLVSDGPQGERRWYVNSMGHTMVVVSGWTYFVMGADAADPNRTSDESQHSAQIRQTFSISSQETTVEQFALFLRETGRDDPAPVERLISTDKADRTNQLPRVNVTWYEAAAYCNWLSAREGLGADQWCYVANEQGEYGPGMRLASDFRTRRGYRLPTEVEWEFACRAGTITRRYFGNEETWLGAYVVCQLPADQGVQPVCRLKPSDFGLFDMLGNAAEWCQEEFRVGDLATPPLGRAVTADRARVGARWLGDRSTRSRARVGTRTCLARNP